MKLIECFIFLLTTWKTIMCLVVYDLHEKLYLYYKTDIKEMGSEFLIVPESMRYGDWLTSGVWCTTPIKYKLDPPTIAFPDNKKVVVILDDDNLTFGHVFVRDRTNDHAIIKGLDYGSYITNDLLKELLCNTQTPIIWKSAHYKLESEILQYDQYLVNVLKHKMELETEAEKLKKGNELLEVKIVSLVPEIKKLQGECNSNDMIAAHHELGELQREWHSLNGGTH